MVKLPPAALGLICENRVIEHTIAGSLGQIVPFKPVTDIDGNDLLIKRRRRPAVVRAQVKGRAQLTALGTFDISVYDSELDPLDTKLIIVVFYDIRAQDVRSPAWVIPSDVYKAGAHHTHGMWDTQFSMKATSRDRWVPYRCAPRDLANVLDVNLDAYRARGAFASARELEAARRRREFRAGARARKRT